MFKVSKMADYGTLIMVDLARHSQDVHNAKAIAERLHLTVPTVSKILKLLAGASLLVSQRGVKGGYSLARSAEQISVHEIIEGIEGELAVTECSKHEGDCSLEPFCSTTGHWQYINTKINNVLQTISLDQLAKPHHREAKIDAADISALEHHNNQ